MCLKTLDVNRANIHDKESGQQVVMVLDSPVLTNKEWALLKKHFGAAAAEIDCTYSLADGPDALRQSIARVRQEAEQAVREGRTEIFLTDENIGPDRVAMQIDRKSTRLNPVTNAHLVCSLLLETKQD